MQSAHSLLLVDGNRVVGGRLGFSQAERNNREEENGNHAGAGGDGVGAKAGLQFPGVAEDEFRKGLDLVRIMSRAVYAVGNDGSSCCNGIHD